MIGKLYSSFKINVLYGEIDILLCSQVQKEKIITKILKLESMLDEHKNKYNEDYLIFRRVNKETLDIYNNS